MFLDYVLNQQGKTELHLVYFEILQYLNFLLCKWQYPGNKIATMLYT